MVQHDGYMGVVLKKLLIEALLFLLSFQNSFSYYVASLNISTGHWTISGKKSSYVQQKLLHNGHSCPA